MKKVTLMTPCYNGELHMMPYINGLLSQTYSNVEYIFIDDGSDDKTEQLINSYGEQFRKKGWSYIYIKQQKRGGQAKAINQGLKVFTGDYLCCIDSDDIIMPTYLEDMSKFLDDNEDCAIAFPWSEEIEEKTFKHLRYFKRSIPDSIKDSLFDDFILQRYNVRERILYASFMLRSSALLSMYPNRHIYEGLSGQNPQLILPILYNYKCGYVKKMLYKAIARKNSDSRLEDKKDFINRTYSWEDIYCNVIKTIQNMPEYEKAYYFASIKNLWEIERNNLLQSRKKRNSFFSITNEYNGQKKHKVITILGIKMKFRA